MSKMAIYNLNSIEFNEFIDNVKVKLKTKNFKYKNLLDKSLKILNDFPNLQMLFEGDIPKKLNNTECRMLHKLILLNMKINDYEEQEIFFLGGKEFYLYLKNMSVI